MEFILKISINGYPFFMVIWNLFLALIPCWLAYRMHIGFKGKKWSQLVFANHLSFVILFLIWFFFFPNTAYLITMVRHLLDHCTDYDPLYRVCREEAWMVPIFFTYSLAGVITFIYALKRMTYVVGQLFHKKCSKIFPIIMIPITSIGILFGLVERFNSWEIITHPIAIIKTGLGYFMDPVMFLNFAVYTIVLYLIYYLVPNFIRRPN